MIVTIDGPAGAGKSTVARLLAEELGFQFLDTGALYRAVTWAALDAGLDVTNQETIGEFTRNLSLSIEGQSIAVNGRDVSREIRTREVTRNIGPIADNPHVRQILTELQRSIARDGNYVCEGRDQGTLVFPDATCKIFLTASPEYRAHRRVRQLEANQVAADYTAILAEQLRRDRQDESRPVGRLCKASDAVEIDTDDLTLDEVVERVKQLVLARKS